MSERQRANMSVACKARGSTDREGLTWKVSL